MRRLVALCVGLVLFAVGCESGEEVLSHESPRDAAVWTSRNASEWMRATSRGLGGPGEQQMTSVIATETGLVAAGFEIVAGEWDALVWESTTGNEWSRVDDVGLRGPGLQAIYAIELVGPGLVAAGIKGSEDDEDAAIWCSDDGSDWVAVDSKALEGRGNQGANAVVAFEGIVYVGGHDYQDAAVWSSPDCENWEMSDAASLRGPGDQTIAAFAITSAGLIAAGSDDRDGAMWLHDGGSWTRIDLNDLAGGDGDQGFTDVVVHGENIFAAAYDFTYDEIFYLGQRPPKGNLDAQVVMSSDGRTWTETPGIGMLGGVGDQSINTLQSWEGVLIGAGYEYAGRGTVDEGVAGFGSGFDVDAAIWLLAEDDIWQRAVSPGLGGIDWQDVWDLAVTPEGYLVAVGGDDMASPSGESQGSKH